MKVNCQITIQGKVQGVFFRASARLKALELGLRGIVKNLDTDKVLIVAEGEEQAVKGLIEWCHSGPPGALVTKVKALPGTVKNYTSFDILR